MADDTTVHHDHDHDRGRRDLDRREVGGHDVGGHGGGGHDGGGHGPTGHAHSHGPRIVGAATAERWRKPLTRALVLTLGFLIVQVAVGVVTGSLAVLSDAGHMATDTLGLAMSLTAVIVAVRSRPGGSRTFGAHRLEILAALANAVLLIGVGVWVLVEAATRLGDPPDIASGPVLFVGVVGLAVNLVAFGLLRQGAKESINVRGAALEVVSDALGSVGVIVGAATIAVTGWGWVDPVLGAAIGVFILPRAVRLGRESLRILLQVAPAHVDPAEITAALAAIDGVVSVHDLHLWTLTSSMDVVTAHLGVDDDADPETVLDAARRMLAADHGLSHATLQVERATGDCTHPDW